MTKEAISTERALKLALEALLGWGKGFPDNWGDLDTEAITALRVALASQGEALNASLAQQALDRMAENARELGLDYGAKSAHRMAAAPSQTDWEAVAADQAMTIALLKAVQQAPVPREPVAYAVYHRMGGGKSLHWPEQHSPDGDANEYQLVPLYKFPPAQRTWVHATTWRGLTDEDIDLFINGRGDEDDEDYVEPTGDGFGLTDDDLVQLVRRSEAKLKEKNT